MPDARREIARSTPFTARSATPLRSARDDASGPRRRPPATQVICREPFAAISRSITSGAVMIGKRLSI